MIDSMASKIVDVFITTIFVFVTFSFGLAIASGIAGKDYKFTELPGVTNGLHILTSTGRELGAKINVWASPEQPVVPAT